MKNNMKNNRGLFLLFCSSASTNTSDLISIAFKEQLYHRIIDIAFHAKSGAILCQFHDKNIEKGLDMTFRGR